MVHLGIRIFKKIVDGEFLLNESFSLGNLVLVGGRNFVQWFKTNAIHCAGVSVISLLMPISTIYS